MTRPDFSEYVAHFTKDANPFGAKENATDAVIKATSDNTAKGRLLSIFQQRKILATPMPWTNKRAVAFTECPWGSLLDHANRYSAFGVGFTKAHLFAAGGGPAIYLRADLFEEQQEFKSESKPTWKGFHPHVYSFVTPFSPPYASKDFKDKHWSGKPPVDFTHEREWRIPHDFTFDLSQVQFVIVPSYTEVAKIPKQLKDSIGREKFIMVDVYSQIEKLWPVHII
jgi:Putative abortive phage resistance protein AbiGi, antitoxin